MNRFRTRDFEYRHFNLPTQEEVLDLNFWSIVSDLRAIVSGHLTPRTWADISETWNHERVINHGRYKIQPVGPIGDNKRPTKKRVAATHASHIRRLTKILISSGKDADTAGKLAVEILGDNQ